MNSQSSIPWARVLHNDGFERRLGNYLANGRGTLEVGRQICAMCLRYIDASSTARDVLTRRRLHFRLLKRMAQPPRLPFAGRLINVSHLAAVLNGEGSLRELLSTAWLFMKFILAEDCASASTNPGCLACAEKSGFDVDAVASWVESAHRWRHSQGKSDPLHAPRLDSKLDLFRLPWTTAYHLRNETREVLYDPERVGRYWSLFTLRQLEADGGELSRFERAYRSDLGIGYIPWLDTRRYTTVNMKSSFIRACLESGLPVATGVSGVTIQLLTLGNMLRIHGGTRILLACLGYLMSIKAHSVVEVAAAYDQRVADGPHAFRYGELSMIDWTDVQRWCGRPIEPD